MTESTKRAIGPAFSIVRFGSVFAAIVALGFVATAQQDAVLPFEMRWVEGSCIRCASPWQLGEALFTSRSEAWAVGATGPVPGQEGMGARTLLHTSDGGHTWSEVPETECYAVPPSVAFLDSKRGWIGRDCEPLSPSVTLRTQDGGASWQDVTGAFPVFSRYLGRQ